MLQIISKNAVLLPNSVLAGKTVLQKLLFHPRGPPLITYASRGGGGGGSTPMHTNSYKGGGGGSDHDQNMHFVCRFIKNGTISEPFKPR